MKDTVSHYVPPHSPLTSTEPQVFSNNLTMPSADLARSLYEDTVKVIEQLDELKPGGHFDYLHHFAH